MFWDHAWGMGWMMYGWLIWLVIVVGVVWIVVRSASRAPGAGPGAEDSPETILKRRYARGDITKEQFETLKRDLQ